MVINGCSATVKPCFFYRRIASCLTCFSNHPNRAALLMATEGTALKPANQRLSGRNKDAAALDSPTESVNRSGRQLRSQRRYPGTARRASGDSSLRPRAEREARGWSAVWLALGHGPGGPHRH